MERGEIKETICQISDGTKYEGILEIGGGIINFEIEFTIPIPKLDDMVVEPEDICGLRRVVVITTKDYNGMEIELSDVDYRFFFGILATLAIEFYNLPQTRSQNRSYLYSAKALRKELNWFPGTAHFKMQSLILSHLFTLEQCEMLQKFGCNLI